MLGILATHLVPFHHFAVPRIESIGCTATQVQIVFSEDVLFSLVVLIYLQAVLKVRSRLEMLNDQLHIP